MLDFNRKCSVNQSKYICPRCNVPYCSLPCYQSEVHLQCSETFYKECVVDEMKNYGTDPESKKKMIEILKRVHKNEEYEEEEALPDSDDESEEEELAVRLAGVDLDDADCVWERLTADERREFEELLKSGDVSKVVPQWQPWWTYSEKKKLVEPLDGDAAEDDNAGYPLPYPAIKADVKPLSSISRVSPSPNIRWNVVNVLAAYTVTARLFNGDQQASPAEAAGTVIALSSNLAQNQVFDSPGTAVAAVHLSAADTVGVCEELQLRQDVRQVVEGPSEERQSDYVLAALSDLHTLLTRARKADKETTTKGKGEFSKRFPSATSESRSAASQLTKCCKKVEFYISWSKECF